MKRFCFLILLLPLFFSCKFNGDNVSYDPDNIRYEENWPKVYQASMERGAFTRVDMTKGIIGKWRTPGYQYYEFFDNGTFKIHLDDNYSLKGSYTLKKENEDFVVHLIRSSSSEESSEWYKYTVSYKYLLLEKLER